MIHSCRSARAPGRDPSWHRPVRGDGGHVGHSVPADPGRGGGSVAGRARVRAHGDRCRDPGAGRAPAGQPADRPPPLAVGGRVRGHRDRDPVGAARFCGAAHLELARRPAHRRCSPGRRDHRGDPRWPRSCRPAPAVRAPGRLCGRGGDRGRRLRVRQRDRDRRRWRSSSCATPRGRSSCRAASSACRRSGSWRCR